ncbi:MAG TPA: squalene--hopene cyclase [Thermoanaerobaculia bacterium]|nr:squalene--hopene cyclase [Thermoanaerobaculia bacterium]
MAAARRWLLAAQHADGHWCGELEGDTILESEYVLVLHFLGRLADPRVGKAARYLRGRQLADGGWAIYPGGPPEVSASVKAYFALKLAGDDPAAPHMQRARATIHELGGIEACNSFTKIYLALCGQYDWWRCPAVPPEMVLLPRWFYFNLYEISSWSRAIVVPLSVVWALRPVRPAPAGREIPELLLPAGAAGAGAAAGSRRIGGVLGGRSRFWRGFFHRLDAALKLGERLRVTPLRRRALARAESWILARLADSDGLGAIFPPIVNTIFALSCLGYEQDHPAVRSQVEELARLEIEEGGSLRLQPCFSATWDTALTLQILAESGPAGPAAEPGPVAGPSLALAAAQRWLLAREVTRPGDWSVREPGAAPGGWCFEYRNPFYPDCDDTAAVLTALSALPGGGELPAARRGLAWLLAMQNRDGGWGAFDRACDKEILTHVPFADHNALLDPSTADVTGRILESLARLGLPPSAPPVARAIVFLLGTQEADGSWYGRWGCNYIYGTWLAVRGLTRFAAGPGEVGEIGEIGEIAGLAPQTPGWCHRAAAWLIGHQNGDGGWGESPGSYDDPTQKGVGPSTAAQTAWALMALFAAGPASPGSSAGAAVERGVGYLLRTQRQDGCWRDEAWTGTGFPRVFYLRYHLYATLFPLQALAEYEHLRRRPAARAGRASSEAAPAHPSKPPYPVEVPGRAAGSSPRRPAEHSTSP